MSTPILTALKDLLACLEGGTPTHTLLAAMERARETVAFAETLAALRKPESWSEIAAKIRAETPPHVLALVLLREEFLWSARERLRHKDENGFCLLLAAATRVEEMIAEER